VERNLDRVAIGPLVSVDWLLDRVGWRDLVVVDCRFALGDPGGGRRAWEEGHIPGAHFLDVDGDLSAPPSVGPEGGGRHPLPSADDFAQACAAAGIGAGSTVVAYDEAGEGGAARLWWLLRHFGHSEVAVLDGGLHGWRAGGGPLDDLPPRPWSSGDPFVPRTRGGDLRVVDADELMRRLEAGRYDLVDARAPARFRGEMEPVDPVAGHIPGARNVPFASVAPDGSFAPPDTLRSLLEPRDGRSLVAYCGSGITGSVLVLAAAVAGLEATLYPGSWSDWCARGLPVEHGD
jgi:thiosulfate/3-mercaptopyruvate sulfurtransferase